MRKDMESIFTFLIIGLSIIWIILITIYAYKNDFSSEILSFFLPVIGAIILSIFVGIKFVFIEAPKEKENFKCTLVIVHDPSNNILYGLACDENLLQVNKNLNKPGLANISKYHSSQLFVDSNLKNFLMNDPLYSNIETNRDQNNQAFSKAIIDVLEYNIFEWLTEINSVSNSWLNDETVYFFPSGYSQQATNLTEPKMVETIMINHHTFPNNPMFKLFALSCNLPTGAKLKSTSSNNFNRVLFIDMNYSKIEIKIQQIGIGHLNQENFKFKDLLAIDNKKSYTSINFQIEIRTVIKPLYRFSKEAKLHPIWHELLIKKFSESYSFEELSAKLR